MSIDIRELENIKEELNALSETDVLFVEEEGKERYVIMPIELFDAIEDIATFAQGAITPQVKIANAENLELSYDEYERIKNQIMEVVEKTLMPKPEKLN